MGRVAALGAAALALATGACGASLANEPNNGGWPGQSAQQQQSPQGQGNGAAPWGAPRVDWEHPSPPVAAALGASERALTGAGFQALPALRAGFWLNEGASSSYRLHVEPGRCYAVVAVGDQGVRDVDLFLVAPDGSSVVEDRETDVHPSLSMCAPYPGDLVVRIQMYSGQGPVHLRAYASGGPPSTQVPLAALVREAYTSAGGGGGAPGAMAAGSAPGTAQGAVPGVPGANEGALEPEARARLEAVRGRLQSMGYSDVGAPVAYALESGRSRDVPTRFEPGVCYAFATLGSAGVRDSDVFVLDGARRELVSDVRTDADAVVSDVCPTSGGAGAVRVRLYAGTGTVWLASFARRGGGNVGASGRGGPARNAAGPLVAAASDPGGGTTLPPVPVAPVGGPAVPGYPSATPDGNVPAPVVQAQAAQGGGNIDASWGVLSQTMSALGLRPVGSPLTNQLGAGQSTANPVRLAAGRCYAFVTASGDGSEGASLALYDAQGSPVGEATAQNGAAVLRACPRREGVHSLRVRMGASGGRYRLGLYEQPR